MEAIDQSNTDISSMSFVTFFGSHSYIWRTTVYHDYQYIICTLCDSGISSFPCAGVSFLPTSISFWLRGTTYQNNSLVTLEHIGEGDHAMLCVTDLAACCRPPYTDPLESAAIGNWFFPNGTRVPSSGSQWDVHRTRGRMVLLLHRRTGGVEGIYICVVPDATNVTQTIYIGVYTNNTGEWCMLLSVLEPETVYMYLL